MIRKMEGAEITAERLQLITNATQRGKMIEQVFSAFLGEVPRDDAIPYVADFFLQLENVRWTLVSGIVNGSFVMSVRNLGYTKNAGDFVRRFFVEIGSAGGHRAMAKAVIPLDAFQARFGPIDDNIGHKMTDLLLEFLHEAPEDKKKKEPVGSHI
jgi:nanoRNase/pAp phosphatase (c-di-AMP/oligoRNAs hydrolase)